MTKDAKGHGSNGKGSPKWDLKQGNSRATVSAPSHSEAMERGRQIGFKSPEKVAMKDPDPEGSRKKAVEAGKHLLGRKIDLSSVKSTNSKPMR